MPLPPHLGARLTLVGGKGGVGKTTTAAALAVALADDGQGVLVVSIDPAHSLADALGAPLGPEPTPVPHLPSLLAMEVDPERERRRFLESHRGALLSLLERGTYLDATDAAGLVDLTIPGLDELAALFRLRGLLARDETLVVDTAPTGHTLRLLELPELARAWLAALQAMEDKGRAVSTALVGAYRPDEASALLRELDQDLEELSSTLHDPRRTRFVLVTEREPVVLAETLRYQDELGRRGIAISGIVVNRSTRSAGGAVRPEADRLIFVPLLAPEPVGVPGLRSFARHLLGEPGSAIPELSGQPVQAVQVGAPFAPPLDRVLYVVGGKGGVGKSTAAAALAVRLQEAGRRVLLLSADPAGSLADVLSAEVHTAPREIEGTEGLWVRQLDAASAWREFRAEYTEEVERLFGRLLTSTGEAGSDRAVVERLVDLAPPGIDELSALMEVVDMTEDRPYDAIVLDTAPTGHFLRLLELPDVALQWTHQLMRLLLKYQEAVAAGELSERLLRLARRLRRFAQRLRDPGHTWLLAVALPEALSVAETERLLARVQKLGIEPAALLLNRLLQDEVAADPRTEVNAADLLRVAKEIVVVAAPALERGPQGVDQLSRFAGGWRFIRAMES